MIADYEALLDEIGQRLTPATHATAVALASLAARREGLRPHQAAQLQAGQDARGGAAGRAAQSLAADRAEGGGVSGPCWRYGSRRCFKRSRAHVALTVHFASKVRRQRAGSCQLSPSKRFQHARSIVQLPRTGRDVHVRLVSAMPSEQPAARSSYGAVARCTRLEGRSVRSAISSLSSTLPRLVGRSSLDDNRAVAVSRYETRIGAGSEPPLPQVIPCRGSP